MQKITSIKGREVIDDSQHENWREAYYRRVEQSRNVEDNNIRDMVHRRDLGPLNILNPVQVAEMIGCSKATAYLYMRQQIIPSFQLGRYWYTHDYIIDTIDKKARALVEKGYARRSFPRMVYKADNGKDW